MNPYWDILLQESRELIAHAEKTGHEYVGVNRARAIVAVDGELLRLRSLVQLVQTPQGMPNNVNLVPPRAAVPNKAKGPKRSPTFESMMPR